MKIFAVQRGNSVAEKIEMRRDSPRIDCKLKFNFVQTLAPTIDRILYLALSWKNYILSYKFIPFIRYWTETG